MTTYPANDITAELQAAAGKGGSGLYTLTGHSVFHQVVPIYVPFELDLNGYHLQMYGEDTPVTLYGRTCTGPAAYFLDSNGNPLGFPGASVPNGGIFNIFETRDASVKGCYLHHGIFDDNIHQASDTFRGSTFLSTLSAGGHTIEQFEIINNYGGRNWYPDPVHIESPNMIVKNYKAGLSTAVPTQPTLHGGVPGGLIGGAGSRNVSSCIIDTVDMVGFLELDGILSALQAENVTGTHILIGNSVPAGSWGGAVWKKFNFSWPGLEVLNFNCGPATDWTIEESVFDGIVNQDPAYAFQGTWGPNNTPASIPITPPPS